ncbi:MAG: neutral/alkaline non-lysosomal ceramidase N-terminal domain-containing protein [Acidobacteriia bacterium]|nr:neutral/alkaline non-lysosomal ceramidase N-terminal domain-containing protein [Terriglobia bacterium]
MKRNGGDRKYTGWWPGSLNGDPGSKLNLMIHTRFLVLAGSLLAATAGFADVVEQGPKDSKHSGLLAGVARADISPPVGIAQLNWGSQTHVEAVGIDPAGMYATALVLSDGKSKFAMVDIDSLSIRNMDWVIKQASERAGIPIAHIRLGATHTHSGPAYQREKGPVGTDPNRYLPAIQAYERAVGDKIAGAIIEANAKLRPAHAYGGKGTGTININRRVRGTSKTPPAVGTNPDGFVDRDLIVFRIDDEKGGPLAVLVNFQCHGTTLTFENKMISPDWTGMVRPTVERALPGALCLYFQGAAGNQGPIEGGTGDLTVAHRLGTILGHQAAALALQIETVRREPVLEGFAESTAFAARQPWRVKGPRTGSLAFASSVVEVPRRTYTTGEIARMAAEVEDARKRLALVANGAAWERYQAEARLRRFEDLLKQWQSPVDASPRLVEVQALRIGEMALVAMPGEPFAEIGAAVRAKSPFAFTMFCGYSSGKGGDYMPIASEYAHGGYEVERTPYGPEAAERVIQSAIALLRSLR